MEYRTRNTALVDYSLCASCGGERRKCKGGEHLIAASLASGDGIHGCHELHREWLGLARICCHNSDLRRITPCEPAEYLLARRHPRRGLEHCYRKA
jgi:hypothetical protein